jgi:hypothetical protein
MKSIVIDNSKQVMEIENSQCYRRSNEPCSDSCPFFELLHGTPYGDVVSLTCNVGQALLLVTGYTESE